ncbi:hypothetical protein BX616_007137, partial [Lobosporangium transversale]
MAAGQTGVIMTLISLNMYLAKSSWALSYAIASFVTMALTWVAITGAATRYRKVNWVLCILSNQLSELPLSVMCMDACFYTWLTLTGTFPVGLLHLFKRSFEVQDLGQQYLDQLSKKSDDRIELPGITSRRFWQQLLNPFIWPKDCTIYENIPYWTAAERLDAERTDGWKSAVDMELDVYQPHSVVAGDDRPVL